MTFTDQADYDIRFEWGAPGLAALNGSSMFVIVDVLSFSTCVAVAVARGASVLPYGPDGRGANDFALRHDAILAGSRSSAGAYSLSPRSLQSISAGTRIVLPSPNGAALSCMAEPLGTVLAGSLINCTAVARRARRAEGAVAVIAAGERWPDGSMRPCLEDLIGAGAIIAALSGNRSPEARIAEQAFEAAERSLEALLLASSSGRELVERGFAEDVQIAATIDKTASAPELREHAFIGGDEIGAA